MDDTTATNLTLLVSVLSDIGTLGLLLLITIGFYRGELFSRATVDYLADRLLKPHLAAIEEIRDLLQELKKIREI